MNSQEVEKFLEKEGITYIKHLHPPVFTCEEADQYCEDIPGIHSKNLFLRDKKGKRHLLVILPSHKKGDLKKVEEISGAKKLAFASPERLMNKLGLEPGSVSPFGLINNKEVDVEIYIDKDVYSSDIVSFHPNKNDAHLELSKKMFHRYLEIIPHNHKLIEFK